VNWDLLFGRKSRPVEVPRTWGRGAEMQLGDFGAFMARIGRIFGAEDPVVYPEEPAPNGPRAHFASAPVRHYGPSGVAGLPYTLWKPEA
jgi:hypothetical protein